MSSEREMSWRVILLGIIVSALAAAAVPYGTLKMGLGVDMSMGAMFFAAVLFEKRYHGQRRAVMLNVIQTMVAAAGGVGFMVVILAAFYYIQQVFGRDIGFNPSWWQLSCWLVVSAILGVYVGALLRKSILDDPSLPWPTGHIGKSVIETLSDEEAGQVHAKRRMVLTYGAFASGFITFMRDGFGVITSMVGNQSMLMTFGLEPMILGLGMMVPIAVTFSGLIGVWVIANFGEQLAVWGSLAGTAPEHFGACTELVSHGTVTDFMTANCGSAAELLGSSVHFRYLVQWSMWPATAMMIAAALTSVLVPLAKNALNRRKGINHLTMQSNADERLPKGPIIAKIALCIGALMWLQSSWFNMPWYQVLMAVAIQPILVIAGLRVLAITGQGPVSLMANATQFFFAIFWPTHIQQNLNAAHIGADPQASAESTIGAFWVARRIGGKFSTLVSAQVISVTIAALVVPLTFMALVTTYGVGLDPGQLSAPTAIKIASLAMVMEKGMSALPHGALTASIIAIIVGIVFELLLMVRKRVDGNIFVNENGNTKSRFGWVPIPSALGFALILPPSMSISFAVGSVIALIWYKFSTDKGGSFDR